MRRLWKRHACGDDGLSLIETVAALVVFALIMSGLAAGMALFAHTQELTKVRNSATSMAQQGAETAKTIPLNQIAVCTGGGQPATYTFQSTSYTVVSGTTPCVPYSSTRTGNGVTFTIKQLVVKDTSGAWDVTVNNQPIAKRMLIVTVSWTVPSSGSYTTSTMLTGKNTLAASVPVGLRVNVNDSTGTLVTASNLVWDYNVNDGSGNSVASGATDDGTSGLLSLSPGAYTCSVVPEDDAGQSYDPGTNPGLSIDTTTETISGTCTVTANNILDWNTTWNEVTACAAGLQVQFCW